MNGIHDMGGMQDTGPIRYEKDEPVFHAPWEGRSFALNLAAAAWGKWNIDAGRHEIELIAPADYLRMSYYERWTERLVQLLLKSGLVARNEIETGKPVPGLPKATPPLTADKVPAMLRTSGLASRNVLVTPVFKVGQRVLGSGDE